MKMPTRSSLTTGLFASLLTLITSASGQILSLESLTRNPDDTVTVVGEIPAGYRYAVLEALHGDTVTTQWEGLISGALNGAKNTVTFTIPNPGPRCIVRLKAGTDNNVPPAALSGTEFMLPSYGEGGTYVLEQDKITHLLNRIAYGPSTADYQMVESMSIGSYISQQLAPQTIDESSNVALNSRMDELFYDFLPNTGEPFISKGDSCFYFKGTVAPPSDWKALAFNHSTWLTGPMGLGYGDDDDATVLSDMSGNYTSVFVRLPFSVPDVNAIENLVLNISYDDGFVAYLNGTEVARYNVNGSPPAHTATAITAAGTVDDPNSPSSFDLNAFKNLLSDGANILAIQGHNQSLSGSSDFSLNASLSSVQDSPYPAIKGDRELQHLMHVRGIYSQRQLQAIMGEFWENHFTTELPKIEDYFSNLSEYRAVANTSVTESNRIALQAEIEAAAVEFDEYEFFYQNALGNFGDLLLYSATSPAMLIYLDSVQNKKGAPNENYAREIFELSALGVDNRYTQSDIEQLAKCFTGWTVRKIRPEDKQSFPDSSRNPPTNPAISVGSETVELPIGTAWKYKIGEAEPTPNGGGLPTTDWTQPGYDDSTWLSGATGIGFGDNDDATSVISMVGNQVAFYTRLATTIPDASSYDALLIDIAYDDGVVVYLNGTEIGRSSTMNGKGTPPAFTATSSSHEVTSANLQIDLKKHTALINPSPALNTIAVQVHNSSAGSGDMSFLPRIVGVIYSADSIPTEEPFGIWAFRFDPNQYDTSAKTIFAGTPYEIQIPARQTSNPALANYHYDGVDDAITVIDALISHPSTAEFICMKLVNRFVSDEISLDTYHNASAPNYLLTLMDDAIAAWNSTSPAGNIATVMSVILDPALQINAFWLEGSHNGKVKNPIEFINSSFRALDADILDTRLPVRTVGLGMNLFTRAEPDGFDEMGPAWMDTQSLLGRIKFLQGLSDNSTYSYGVWDLSTWLATHNLTSPQEVIDHLNTYIFGGMLSAERQSLFLDFVDTDDNGNTSAYTSLSANQKDDRMRKLISLILSAPEFQYQ